MEILRSYSQIVNKTKQVFDVDISEIPFLDKMHDYDLENLAEKANLCENPHIISELAELVFQLNEFSFALTNYIKMFLYMKQYDAVYYFLSKLFVSHVGSSAYSSKLQIYSYEERFFDRFIEVVKFANIELELYLPLVLNAISKDTEKIYVWKAPAMEYMQTFIRENEDEVSDYVLANDQYELEFLKLILEFNTQKGISILFDNKKVQRIGEEKAEQFLKQYIKDTLAFFDKNLENAGENRFHYIKVLSSIKNNNEVETRLVDVFENETNPEIKEYLSKLLGLSEKQNFGTDKHFKVLAQKKVTNVQERSLGCAFENMPLVFVDGTEANNQEKTYLIDIFKEQSNLQNLYGLNSLYDVFEKQSLNKFANILFNKLSKKDDINCAKWAVRMFALLSDGLEERMVYEFLIVLYKLGRKKEAYYLTECLLYSKKHNFLEVFTRLSENKYFQAKQQEFEEIYSKECNVSLSKVKDALVPQQYNEEIYEQEKQRLYWEFIAGRKYSISEFEKYFIHKPLFNDFAQKLIFGEYKNGKLYSIFKVEGLEKKYIFGAELSSEDAIPYISIVHTLDLDERFEKLVLPKDNLLFNQFPKLGFDVKNFNRTSISVQNLEGMLVNGKSFVEKLQEKQFKINANADDVVFPSLVHIMPLLDLLAEVEFEKPISNQTQTATLGQIRFYRLSEVMKDKQAYITNKASSISVGSLPERYFEYVLSSVYNSIG